MTRIRILDWEFNSGGPHILLVRKSYGGSKHGFIDEDEFDIEYGIFYNADQTVDVSAWKLINVGHNSYVEVTEAELALLLLINC